MRYISIKVLNPNQQQPSSGTMQLYIPKPYQQQPSQIATQQFSPDTILSDNRYREPSRQQESDQLFKSSQGESISRNEVDQMIQNRLNDLRVYVVESDITDAQNIIKAVVEQASF